MDELPQRTRIYQNHHMDSTRWDYLAPRDDDIVIATSYKAGTTWTQAIVAHLLFPDGRFPAPPFEMSPWLDMRVIPLEVVLNNLKTQSHRRFIKTHLPLDGLPYRKNTKYLYIARDARDVFMSLWNHYTGMKDEAFVLMNHLPGRQGDELSPPPADVHVFWKNWMTRGSFAWESDGWPYWSHLSNVQSWWFSRHLPNIELIHYNDMLVDTAGAIRRIAAFLEITVSDHTLDEIVKAVSFAKMKQQGELYVPGGGRFWKGGAETFMHKGVNERWRSVLSNDELVLYDNACKRALTDESRAWLENGGPV